eukprot:SAG22_NODE_7521_length_731_cov_3.779518_1_plen_50_part_10
MHEKRANLAAKRASKAEQEKGGGDTGRNFIPLINTKVCASESERGSESAR